MNKVKRARFMNKVLLYLIIFLLAIIDIGIFYLKFLRFN